MSYKYSWTITAHGRAPQRGVASDVDYGWNVSVTGKRPKGSHGKVGDVRYIYDTHPVHGHNNEPELDPYDRFRFIVQETRTGKILTRDMVVSKPIIMRQLSGSCSINCDVDPHDMSVEGIYFKPWEQYIHVEKVINGVRKIWATGIVQPSQVDKKTGVLHLTAKGFACYPKGEPWLQDVNWIANDAYKAVHYIWDWLQAQPGGNLNVTVYPQISGIEMLPGYEFTPGEGQYPFNLNFFATFNRAVDKVDCGDYIDALAKDIPFDYREEQDWNAERTDVVKRIQLGYPRLGEIKPKLAFVINENVLEAVPHIESEIDWVSDVVVSGFYPGVEYSYQLANADPKRLRRSLKEIDAGIDSEERAKAWAGRRLARRQAPAYWENITVQTNHPNAPFGSYDIGDTIVVQGFMPWVGYISQEHKILSIGVQGENGTAQLSLMAEGAFNYDPIFFPGNDTSILPNGAFNFNLNGWHQAENDTWTLDRGHGDAALGSVTVTADGTEHVLTSDAFGFSDYQKIPFSVKMKVSNGVSQNTDAIQLIAQFSDDDGNLTTSTVIDHYAPAGDVAWTKLKGYLHAPAASTSTHVALQLRVSANAIAGQIWFDDAELVLA